MYSTSPSGALVVADLNGDSLLDLAALQPVSSSIGVFFNKGKGTFAGPVVYETGDPLHDSAIGLAVGDVNGDRVPDLVVAHFVYALDSTRYLVEVFLNAGDGTLAAVPDPLDTGDFAPEWIAVGDLNGDGVGDLVALHSGSPAEIGVFLASGGGAFSNPIVVNGGSCTSTSNIAMGDLDGDGRPDLAFFCDNQLRVFLNRGGPQILAGAVSYPGSPTVPVTANSQPTAPSAAVGNLSSDGYLDIAITDGVSSTIGLFLNRGDGTFIGPTVVTTDSGSVLGTVAIADLDGNGASDIVTTNTDSNTIGVLLAGCLP